MKEKSSKKSVDLQKYKKSVDAERKKDPKKFDSKYKKVNKVQ